MISFTEGERSQGSLSEESVCVPISHRVGEPGKDVEQQPSPCRPTGETAGGGEELGCVTKLGVEEVTGETPGAMTGATSLESVICAGAESVINVGAESVIFAGAMPGAEQTASLPITPGVTRSGQLVEPARHAGAEDEIMLHAFAECT